MRILTRQLGICVMDDQTFYLPSLWRSCVCFLSFLHAFPPFHLSLSLSLPLFLWRSLTLHIHNLYSKYCCNSATWAFFQWLPSTMTVPDPTIIFYCNENVFKLQYPSHKQTHLSALLSLSRPSNILLLLYSLILDLWPVQQ